jgi:hypothetical protein
MPLNTFFDSCGVDDGSRFPSRVGGDAVGGVGPVNKVTRLFAQQNLHDIPVERVNRIPAEERTKALQDLHGMSFHETEETPDLIERRLGEMDLELTCCIDEPCRYAYEEAMEQNAAYVKGLRLAFLRAEDFRVSKAAFQML